jgi:excisionase family DNA binding protein
MSTVGEVAKKLRISARMVYKLVEAGKLRSYKIGSAIRISDEQLQAYLAGCEVRWTSNEAPTRLRQITI